MPLESRQLAMLEELVEIPSCCDHPFDERAILERIEEYFHGSECRVRRVPIADDPHGRWNLIVEKGSGSKSALLYGHVDTFTPRWKDVDFRLHRSGQRLYGPGVYDMKAGVMEIIDQMLYTPVPPGMKFVAVFSPDEELHSRGAADKDLHRQLASYDIVAGLSPEIGVADGHDSDDPKQMIVARRGVLKCEMMLETDQGHGARRMMNAVRLNRELQAAFEMSARDEMPGYMNIVSHVEEAGSRIPWASDLSHPHQGKVRVKCLIAPPMTVREALNMLRTSARNLVASLALKDDAVRIRRMRHGRSYNPYTIDLDTPMAKAILGDATAHIYGNVRLIADGSPSDGNILAPLLQSGGKPVPWIEGSAPGGREHSKDEWTDEEGVVRNMAFIHHALTRSIPDALATHS